MKICSKCDKQKNRDCFYQSNSSPDGLRYMCKECAKSAARKNNKERRRKNPERVRRLDRENREKHKQKYNKRDREWRKNNPELALKKQRKERKAFVKNNPNYQSNYYKENRDNFHFICVKTWNSIKKRTNQNLGNHGAEGKNMLSRSDFLDWCKKTKEKLMNLQEVYRESGYNMKYAPSIDRIDPDYGYTLSNIQWLSLSQNSKKYHSQS